MKFTTIIQVRFAHTDQAGIVFYPRYFEMINQTVEDWFAGMGFDFRTLHVDRGEGVPTVHVEVDFHAASRLGDMLAFELEVERLGNSTVALVISVRCEAEHRLTIHIILAYVTLNPLKSCPIPDGLRSRMADFQIGPATG
jgi:4-hydroxybenzoyl-CoA thioesterase